MSMALCLVLLRSYKLSCRSFRLHELNQKHNKQRRQISVPNASQAGLNTRSELTKTPTLSFYSSPPSSTLPFPVCTPFPILLLISSLSSFSSLPSSSSSCLYSPPLVSPFPTPIPPRPLLFPLCLALVICCSGWWPDYGLVWCAIGWCLNCALDMARWKLVITI